VNVSVDVVVLVDLLVHVLVLVDVAGFATLPPAAALLFSNALRLVGVGFQ